MKLNVPTLQLISLGGNEWRFQESLEMQLVTEQFDAIWERFRGDKKLGAPLKKLLTKHPNHVDGLYHYAMHRLDLGHLLDAYTYTLAAITTARAAVPPEFNAERDRIPYGYVSNRPFHRALNGLMSAQAALGDLKSAIKSAYEQLSLDREDRMGVRVVLPIYLLEDEQPEATLRLFAKSEFHDTFRTELYLKALALLSLERVDEGRTVLKDCVSSFPQVARYILDTKAETPQNNSYFGIAGGSEYEGWFYGYQYAPLWRKNLSTLDVLREVSAPFAATRWQRETSE